jgi:stearoyl-CoA desaturase (delta-9 desaturase)
VSTITAEASPQHHAEVDAEPSPAAPPRPSQLQIWLTLAIVFGPVLALGYAVVRFWGTGITLLDLILATVLYFVAGHGVTIGFHRLLTHKSFRTSRPVKVALTVAGSMSFQGGVTSWVANHRRHHSYTERDGDPHSPHGHGDGLVAHLRGLWHAHMGWFFKPNDTSTERYAPDLLEDRDVVVVNALFPLWCVVSLALPFGLGYFIGGSLMAGLTALLWAGAVRICLLQHVTWSVNSVCHMFGRRPFKTRDRSTNISGLAILSMGESWHNAHHAFPTLARHGVDRGQLDTSAMVIRFFERLGWAWEAHWPTTAVLAKRRA